MDGSPECFCPSGWSGDRCHLRQDSNSPLPQPQDPSQPQDPNQDEALLLNVSVAHLEVLVLVLAATSLALLLLVVALAVVIFRLKQRPRIIRKRWERYDYRDHVLSYIITPDVKQTTKMIKETAFDTYNSTQGSYRQRHLLLQREPLAEGRRSVGGQLSLSQDSYFFRAFCLL